MNKLPFYVGTYTSGTSRGIHRSFLNLDDGTLSPPHLVAKVDNPTFLALHPQLDVLYSTSEVRHGGQREHAQALAFKINEDATLMALGGLPTGGEGPCFVSTDLAGKFVFVANYASGSVTALTLDAEGRLQQRASTVQHHGRSVEPARQEGPHAHCIMTDPSDQFVCAVDLGLDQIVIYELVRATGEMRDTGNLFMANPGLGPRHLAFHPDGIHAFVIHEMASQVSTCKWDSQTGTMSELQRVSTLPKDFSGTSSTAEILVHPSGKFVYGSNRGHDSIAIFDFDVSSSRLTPAGHCATLGKNPRNFRLDQSGAYLLAANQDSHSVVAFRIDQHSGGLIQVGAPIEIGSPCCIKFFMPKS